MHLKSCSGLLIVSLLLSASPVWAGIYKWTDDAGKLHFTDDKSRIPLQYRSPDRVERLKGMIEPPAPKKEEAPVEEVEDPNAAENPDETAEAEMEEEPKEAMDPKLMAMINETLTFFEQENKKHQSLVESGKPVQPGEGPYAWAVRKFLSSKKKLVKKLEKFELPSLKASHKFLKDSARRDEKFERSGEGNENNVKRLVNLKKRLKIDIESKKLLIAQLMADLDEPAE